MHDREYAYRQIFKENMKENELKHMPNQYWHKVISFTKSTVRVIGYGFIPFDLMVATMILIFSELIGVVEELV